jgi:hypothetical protein
MRARGLDVMKKSPAMGSELVVTLARRLDIPLFGQNECIDHAGQVTCFVEK